MVQIKVVFWHSARICVKSTEQDALLRTSGELRSNNAIEGERRIAKGAMFPWCNCALKILILEMNTTHGY